ncbi:hypothetical protein [Thioclava kandeliae]|uniref:Uncharacterized protein n=1 Tax=Thioclava kandeliae TaxID=3070818 RepID=A0ABV1SL98_9RHOB
MELGAAKLNRGDNRSVNIEQIERGLRNLERVEIGNALVDGGIVGVRPGLVAHIPRQIKS